MQSTSTDTTPRSFDPTSIPGLSKKARDAVNSAFDAMSSWRNEAADTSERNSKLVIERLAAAAAALGWPEQIVDAVRRQLETISELQIKTIDQVMDAWEEQLKLPNAMSASPTAILSKLKPLPGFGPAGSWPGAEALQKAAGDPLQFWMQLAQQWQKSWTDTMAFWASAGKPH